jgi:hypothetical protein
MIKADIYAQTHQPVGVEIPQEGKLDALIRHLGLRFTGTGFVQEHRSTINYRKAESRAPIGALTKHGTPRKTAFVARFSRQTLNEVRRLHLGGTYDITDAAAFNRFSFADVENRIKHAQGNGRSRGIMHTYQVMRNGGRIIVMRTA